MYPKKSHPFDFDRSAGFSVIEALLAVGVVGIVAGGIAAGLSYSKRSQKTLEVKQSSTQFQESLRGALSKVTRKFMTDTCTGQKTYNCSLDPKNLDSICDPVAVVNGGSGDSGGGPNVSKNIGGSGGGPALSGISPVQAFFSNVPLGNGASFSYTESVKALSEDQKAVAARCARPILGASDGGKLDKGEFYRFCVNITPPSDKKFGSDSFWSQSSAFAEILIVPVAFSTDSPMMCRDITSGGEGAKVVFSIYFVSKQGKKTDPAKKTTVEVYTGHRNNGVFYVSSQ